MRNGVLVAFRYFVFAQNGKKKFGKGGKDDLLILLKPCVLKMFHLFRILPV